MNIYASIRVIVLYVLQKLKNLKIEQVISNGLSTELAKIVRIQSGKKKGKQAGETKKKAHRNYQAVL